MVILAAVQKQVVEIGAVENEQWPNLLLTEDEYSATWNILT
jgi:hypothetical protein